MYLVSQAAWETDKGLEKEGLHNGSLVRKLQVDNILFPKEKGKNFVQERNNELLEALTLSSNNTSLKKINP